MLIRASCEYSDSWLYGAKRAKMAELIDQAMRSKTDAVTDIKSEEGVLSFTVGDEPSGSFYHFEVTKGVDAQTITITSTPYENRGNPAAETTVTDISADGTIDEGKDAGIRNLIQGGNEEWRDYFQTVYDGTWEILRINLQGSP